MSEHVVLILFFFSVKLDNCIICNNAKILEKSNMKDCDVAGGYIVDKDSKCISRFTLMKRSTKLFIY